MRLSAVILARNEEGVIEDCLESVKWADEIILVDSGSTDKTCKIAKEYGAKIVDVAFKGLEFSRWRNLGKEKAIGDWILYVDADERATPLLRTEIEKELERKPQPYTAFSIPRRNFFLGREMRYGGAWPDYVKRLFLKKKLNRWERKLHEDPIFEGKMGKLENPLVHITHRDLTSMLTKTIAWTEIEAELLYRAKHPPVVWWRFFRMMATKFFERIVKLGGWRDGTEGWINAIFETFNTFIIYARLWERQQKDER